jgi:hypothetical protein
MDSRVLLVGAYDRRSMRPLRKRPYHPPKLRALIALVLFVLALWATLIWAAVAIFAAVS